MIKFKNKLFSAFNLTFSTGILCGVILTANSINEGLFTLMIYSMFMVSLTAISCINEKFNKK